MTGAPISLGCETIVPLEEIEYKSDSKVKLPQKLTPNRHIRKKGEELQSGKKYLSCGDEATLYGGYLSLTRCE
ncbi:MAG TPA: hypothetical protein ENN12_04185 [Epsilonproteobacteria bacterium]|nr:hypothetical protein [Campylobacterota bacterium]